MIERFLALLVEATARIPAHYFQLPTAGGVEAIYRERVYCYELYHQLRRLLEGEERLARYALSGEVDKQGHAIMRQYAPDFVFHIPGRMENLVVVEVKPVNASLRGIQKDLDTLTYFVSPPVSYQCGVHLVYGNNEDLFARFKRKFCALDPEQLLLFWHRHQGEPATRIA
jgi:hypothetical protein